MFFLSQVFLALSVSDKINIYSIFNEFRIFSPDYKKYVTCYISSQNFLILKSRKMLPINNKVRITKNIEMKNSYLI